MPSSREHSTLAIFSLNGSWNLPEDRPDLTSIRCPPSIVQRFGRLPFRAASGDEARRSALPLIFSMREGTDEAVVRKKQLAELFAEIVLEAVDVAPCGCGSGGADPILVGQA